MTDPTPPIVPSRRDGDPPPATHRIPYAVTKTPSQVIASSPTGRAKLSTKQGVPAGTPCFIRESADIIDDAVAAVVSLVNHSEASAIVFVTEGEEAMLQQVHLQHRLVPGHGLEVELLDTDDG